MISMLKNTYSAFVIDNSKVDLFLSQKSSKHNKEDIKNRAKALQEILKDDTATRNK